MLDFQKTYTITCVNQQPDLDSLVRLFLNNLARRSLGIFNLKKYFSVYLTTCDEAVIGSNNLNFEIRIYFFRRREHTSSIFLIFAFNHLNWLGGLQSLYLRPLIFLGIRSTLRIIGTPMF